MWTLVPAFFNGYASDVYKEVAARSKLHVSQVVSVQILDRTGTSGQYVRLVVWYWQHVPGTEPNEAVAALMAPDPDLEPDLVARPGWPASSRPIQPCRSCLADDP
jgi:hypothetical protein